MTKPPLPSLAGAEWLQRAETQAVFRALAAAGFAARAVGGVVRNALMGLPVTDIDIATPARPEQTIAACRTAGLATVPTGIEHGTVTVVVHSQPLEVTTLRADVETDGRHATVAFTDDWAADASRRDFTINALYCDADGTVHDPLGGYADLVAHRVRFIGDPDQRIAEDYLRILRFFRFHAVLGAGALDPAGQAAAIRGRAGLQRLSAERVRVEVLKLLVAPRASDAVAAMMDCGLLTQILGVAPRPGVLAALIQAERLAQAGPDAILRLSALTLAVGENRNELADRLRLSNAVREALIVVDLDLCRQFDGLETRAARRLLYRFGPASWRRSVLGAMAAMPENQRAAMLPLLALPQIWPMPKLPVKGADVLAHGMQPGPAVGALLKDLEDWWVASDFPSAAAVRDRLAALAAERKG